MASEHQLLRHLRAFRILQGLEQAHRSFPKPRKSVAKTMAFDPRHAKHKYCLSSPHSKVPKVPTTYAVAALCVFVFPVPDLQLERPEMRIVTTISISPEFRLRPGKASHSASLCVSHFRPVNNRHGGLNGTRESVTHHLGVWLLSSALDHVTQYLLG